MQTFRVHYKYDNKKGFFIMTAHSKAEAREQAADVLYNLGRPNARITKIELIE